MGRLQRSWELTKQSFAVLRADKQLLLFPLASGIACILATALYITGGAILFYPYFHASLRANPHWRPSGEFVFAAVYFFYAINYFVMVYFNVALVSVASNRLAGGTATLSHGLSIAWQRKGKIAQWALLAATVGTVLKFLEQRAGWLGRIAIRLIGVAWTLASFFVVPVLAFENLGPIDALKRSSRLFRDTWGERVGAGLAFGLIFLLLALPGIGIFFLALMAGGPGFVLAGAAFLLIYLVLLSAVSSAMQGIFMAGLYRYATCRKVANGFSEENFSMAWQPK